MINQLEELEIWQEAVNICIEVYDLTDRFPNAERYTLIQQIHRSAISIASNMAEGFGRKSNGDFKRFLNIAIGSLFELKTQLILAERLNYWKKDTTLYKRMDVLGKRSRALAKSLS